MPVAAAAAAGFHFAFGTIIAFGGLVSLLIVAAGIIGASFRVSRNTQTLANYREAADAWEAKATAQELKISDQQTEISHLQQQSKVLDDRLTEKDNQIAALQEQVQGLRDLLTNRAAFETLVVKMSELAEAVHGNGQDIKLLLSKAGP